jgi:hypothetical protein
MLTLSHAVQSPPRCFVINGLHLVHRQAAQSPTEVLKPQLRACARRGRAKKAVAVSSCFFLDIVTLDPWGGLLACPFEVDKVGRQEGYRSKWEGTGSQPLLEWARPSRRAGWRKRIVETKWPIFDPAGGEEFAGLHEGPAEFTAAGGHLSRLPCGE